MIKPEGPQAEIQAETLPRSANPVDFAGRGSYTLRFARARPKAALLVSRPSLETGR